MTGGNEFNFKLSDALKKGPVVMYFFPAAFTAGCTIETQKFADKAEEFKAAGATLVGLTAGAAMADGKMVSATDNLARLAGQLGQGGARVGRQIRHFDAARVGIGIGA